VGTPSRPWVDGGWTSPSSSVQKDAVVNVSDTTQTHLELSKPVQGSTTQHRKGERRLFYTREALLGTKRLLGKNRRKDRRGARRR